MYRTLSSFAMAAVALGAAVASAQVSNSQPVDAEEVLRVPAVNYRKEWVQLGTFSVLANKPQDGAKELHAVYTERKNLDAYLKDGKFPDGAVFVKDVWNAKTEELPTGTSSFAGDLAGRFVMVKDSAGKLGSGPRFGDGWGWAFFAGNEKVKTVTGNYKVDCLDCHEPARNQGLQFLQGYPLLRK
jgi:Cytochrome P460